MHRKTSKRIGNTTVTGNLNYGLNAASSECNGKTSQKQRPIAGPRPSIHAADQSPSVSPSVSLCLLRAAATDTLDAASAINDEGMASMANGIISYCEARLRA